MACWLDGSIVTAIPGGLLRCSCQALCFFSTDFFCCSSTAQRSGERGGDWGPRSGSACVNKPHPCSFYTAAAACGRQGLSSPWSGAGRRLSGSQPGRRHRFHRLFFLWSCRPGSESGPAAEMTWRRCERENDRNRQCQSDQPIDEQQGGVEQKGTNVAALRRSGEIIGPAP